MTDFILPPDLIASEAQWQIIDNTAVFSSAMSGAVRTYSRPGNRWGCRLVFRNTNGTKRHRLLALIAALRGRSNRIWITDPAYTQAGSLAAPELLTNNAAVAATTGWTSSNAELALSADSHLGLRLTRTGVTADRYAYQAAFTTVSSAPYAIRGLVGAGKGAVNMKLAAGTSQGATGLLNGTPKTTAGRIVETFTASGASTHASFHDLIAGRVAGDFQFLTHASVARCGLVAGGSQTGASLAVDGLPVSSAGLLRAGDWIEVNGELKRLVADLNTDAAGAGTMLIEPPLRNSPADNVPVVVRTPMGRFLLSDESVGWSTSPGTFSTIELSLIEDVA
jgi:hypothetical protein